MQTPSTSAFFDRHLAGQIIVPARNNFVERPWGGTQLRALKRLCPIPDQVSVTGAGLGESFELAAFDDDREAARHPSKLTDRAGNVTSLPALIREHADMLLGDKWQRKYGRCVPLLPKFLNVRELLSVQGHPAGHTEAYVVVAAEPGATIRLGFNTDIDQQQFAAELAAGISDQGEFAALLGEQTDWFALQRRLSAWLANKESDAQSLLPQLRELSVELAGSAARAQAVRLVDALKRCYWRVLDSMNEIELHAGQVIHNSNPQRILATAGGLPAAEVHALGNPEGREFVMLEVRRPGPTLRAWDNVRFPMREVDIAAAMDVLNLRATRPEEFISARRPGAFQGHCVSVDSQFFRIEHVDSEPCAEFEFACEDPHCLHVLSGSLRVSTEAAPDGTELRSGESAFVPYGIGQWHGSAGSEGLSLAKVHLP